MPPFSDAPLRTAPPVPLCFELEQLLLFCCLVTHLLDISRG